MKTTLPQKPFCTVFIMYHTQPKNRPNGQNFYTLLTSKEGVVNFQMLGVRLPRKPDGSTGDFNCGCCVDGPVQVRSRPVDPWVLCCFFFFFGDGKVTSPEKKWGIFGTNHYNDPYEPHQFFNGTKWGFKKIPLPWKSNGPTTIFF